MTDISLPYDQVCEIIAEEGVAFIKRTKPKLRNTSRAFMELEKQYSWFGHTLWRALEEAHFARQGKE